MPTTSLDPTIRSLRRRLDRWELDHLRHLAADLSERLEKSELAASQAEESADFWRDSFMQLQESLYDENDQSNLAIGLTKSGQMVIVRTADPSAEVTAAQTHAPS